MSDSRVNLPNKGFWDLLAAAQTGFCSGCGTCSVACPLQLIEFEDNLPTLGDGLCLDDLYESCGLCTLVCPQGEFEVTKGANETAKPPAKAKRRTPQFYLGSAKDPLIRKRGQAGGVVTALLAAGVETGFLDAVTVVQGEKLFEPSIAVVNTRKEIIAGAGTKYTRVPAVEAAWSLRQRYGKQFAFTGTPCMINGMRRLQSIGFHDNVKSSILIGVFCSKSFLAKDLKRKVLESTDRPADQVSRIAIKGKVKITFNDGQSKMVKLGNILKAAQDSCKYCSDFLAEQADLSVGEMGIPPGKSVIMIRTQKGHDLVMNAKNSGELLLEPCETLLVQNLQKWDAKKRASAKVRNFPPPQKKTLLREELETSSQTDIGKTDEWPIQIPDFEHL